MNHSSLRDLRIADLELFITAAHLKSLGKAAAFHHLSQSAASSAILRVEAAFGLPLCEHERRQFKLTEEGKRLLPRAESWLRSLKESVAAEEKQPIRLATTHAIARVAIPAIWSTELVDLILLRPDQAYAAILRDEADIALVLDNAPWEGVIATEVGEGYFQLYSSREDVNICPILLPEDQIEVLTLQQRWSQAYGRPLAIKARLPSWSLIADLCATSKEVGFLPDFLAQQLNLFPVPWQPMPSHYRLLALHKRGGEAFQERIEPLLSEWKKVFAQELIGV